MRAVWSFWSKPYQAYKGRIWGEPRHHLLAWGLSLRLAQRQFPETLLVTDSQGKALLVDRLGLDFTHVSTELDSLRHADQGWWALGKLVAYSLQDQPFVHLDTDVFLWRPLPAWLITAPVFAQCPERHSLQHAWCPPHEIEALFAGHKKSLPPEWEWSSSRGEPWFREENCGILGANNLAFLHYYANAALQLALDPAHAAVWADLPEKSGFNMIIEQHFLSACLDYHRHNPESRFRGIGIRYLFPTFDDAFNADCAARAGFTHLLGDAKTRPEVTARLERRVAELDPAFHRHCQRLATHPALIGGLA